VRTEITFGLASPSSANVLTSPLPNLTTSEIPLDGCTALSHLTRTSSFLAQNWDWLEAQQANLILLCISARDKPTIKMMTEAGIIGKIGLNSSGVGVCLNAIRAVGMDATRMPVHLALRAVLESRSMGVAVQSLESCGVASACHMLLGDAQGSVGLEWSCRDLVKVEMDARGEVVHSNHYLLPHAVPEANGWVDSPFRFERMTALARGLGHEATMENVRRLFEDEKNSPAGICRKQEGASTAATLFNIVMDLKAGTAVVKMGRPTGDGEEIEITF
jgi:isopenicillin-N N-acyltransferase-like protein